MLTRSLSAHGSPLRYASGLAAASWLMPQGSLIAAQSSTSQYAGLPVGASPPVAFAMAIKPGGVACHMAAGSPGLTANAAGSYAQGAATMAGAGAMSASGFLTAERTVVMAGSSSMSATAGGTYANGRAVMRIGFNPTADDIANAVLDTSNVEAGLTVRQALRLIAAAVVGRVSGAPSGPVAIRAAVSDHKTRITATIDGQGNVISVTTDVTT